MAFGEPPRVLPTYKSRTELALEGVHRQREGGIAGSGLPGEGAESIVLSDEYEDDVDLGDTILYTGHGARDPKTKNQLGDQEFKRFNKSLAENVVSGQPVRVVRRVAG
jgi:putative restriction endonuclease